jgi:ABC-type Fe3+ transport system substrate-binding protein
MDRFVLTDAQWAKMEPLCLGKPSDPGRSEPVVILKSTRNPEAARAFADFILSPDGQALASRQGAGERSAAARLHSA